MKELNIFKRQTTLEKQEIERVMKDKSVVDEHVVKALNQAGNVSKEALRIKAEMDKFYEENREWLAEEDRQLGEKNEVLNKQDEKIIAKIEAAR